MEGLGHSGIRTLIVIPCLNEAKTIEGLLVKFTGAMQGVFSASWLPMAAARTEPAIS